MTDIAQHWIDGEWVGSEQRSESINPATGEVLGQWYDGGEVEAASAIAAARRAFDASTWSRDRGLRNQVLTELAERFDAHAEELGTLVTKENGKKIAEGLFEGGSPSPTLRHNAAMALTDTGIAAEVAPGQWYTHLCGAGRGGRDNRSMELSGCTADPFPRSRPCGREHRGRENAGADRPGRQPGIADHCRG